MRRTFTWLSTVGVALIFMAPLLAQTPGQTNAADAGGPTPLTVMDEFSLQLATDPQISPDGKRVVYVRQFNDVMTDKRYSNLWMVNADGSDHRVLTTGMHKDTSPRWSPDGTQLIYISDRDGRPQIYRRWMDSGQT